MVLFAYNPVFRAYEESGEHLLANALLYPSGRAGAEDAARRDRRRRLPGGAAASSAARRPRRRRATSAARGARSGCRVPAAQEAAALAVVRRYAEPAAVQRSGGAAVIVLANPEGLQADEHPYARDAAAGPAERGGDAAVGGAVSALS